MHVVIVVQDPAFGVVEYVPLAHAVQVRFVVGVPAVDTYWPAVHVVHAVQVVPLP